MATISEGLAWQKTLSKRRAELVVLRDKSSTKQWRAERYGGDAVPGTMQEPTYNAVELDKTIARLAREERLLETAIKRANAATRMDYEINDEVLGELV